MTNTKRLFTNHDLWVLFIPLIIERFLQVIVGMVDSIMVSSVSEAAVSGVSIVDQIMVLVIFIFQALASGGAVVTGQFLGMNKEDKANEAANQLIKVNFLLGLLVTAILFFGRDIILTSLFGDVEPDVYASARTYLTVTSLSIPLVSINASVASIFKTLGDSKSSMTGSLIINGINCVGNAILIYGFKLGVLGAAIPTLIARSFGALWILSKFIRGSKGVKLELPINLKFDKELINKILYIGIPSGIENGLFQFGKLLLVSLVATMPTSSIAANAIGNTISCFSVITADGICIGMTTVASRCVGARDYEQVRHYTKKMVLTGYAALVVNNIIIFALLPLIIKAYHLTPETAELAKGIVISYGIAAVALYMISFGLPSTLRSANDVKYCMATSLISVWLFRIVSAYLFAKYTNLGVYSIWYATYLDWVVRAISYLIRYNGHTWEKHKI